MSVRLPNIVLAEIGTTSLSLAAEFVVKGDHYPPALTHARRLYHDLGAVLDQLECQYMEQRTSCGGARTARPRGGRTDNGNVSREQTLESLRRLTAR